MTDDLDQITARYGLPKPVDTDHPGFTPRLAAPVDLDEFLGDMPVPCCCNLHRSLHNARTCCPTHQQARAGLPVPMMTPADADAAYEREPEHPRYDTTLDPCSPDFDLRSWA